MQAFSVNTVFEVIPMQCFQFGMQPQNRAVFHPGDTAYLIHSNRFVREVTDEHCLRWNVLCPIQ